MTRLRLAAPVLLALALAYLFDLGTLTLGTLLGVAAFASLLLAQRPASIKLGALALAAGFSLGLSAAIFSALLGQSVRDMVATGSSAVGTLLGVGALLLAVFGLLCIIWGALTPRSD